MSRARKRWLICAGIFAAAVLFGAVIQNILLGAFLGAIIAVGYAFADASWSKSDRGVMDDDHGAQL